MYKFEKIFVEITEFCGLNCSFCTPTKSNSIMDLDKFKHISKQISPYTKLCALHILGDPLSLDNIDDYIKIAKKEGLKLEITSSGFYLDENKINILLTSDNIFQINISLTSALYQYKPISIQQYMNNILLLCKKHKEANSQIFINLRLWNLDKNLNAPSVNNEIYKILEQSFNIKTENNHKVKLDYKIHLIQKPFFQWGFNHEVKTAGFCHGTINQLGILTNGSVVPCCFDTKGEITIGNILHDSFIEILNKQRFKKMRDGFKSNIRVESICQKCSYPDYLISAKNV